MHAFSRAVHFWVRGNFSMICKDLSLIFGRRKKYRREGRVKVEAHFVSFVLARAVCVCVSVSVKMCTWSSPMKWIMLNTQTKIESVSCASAVIFGHICCFFLFTIRVYVRWGASVRARESRTKVIFVSTEYVWKFEFDSSAWKTSNKSDFQRMKICVKWNDKIRMKIDLKQ